METVGFPAILPPDSVKHLRPFDLSTCVHGILLKTKRILQKTAVFVRTQSATLQYEHKVGPSANTRAAAARNTGTRSDQQTFHPTHTRRTMYPLRNAREQYTRKAQPQLFRMHARTPHHVTVAPDEREPIAERQRVHLMEPVGRPGHAARLIKVREAAHGEIELACARGERVRCDCTLPAYVISCGADREPS